MTDNPLLHVAIIPDGNRRWAKKRLLQPWKGHEKSAENFEDLLNAAANDGQIGTLTIWCFSTENWKRSPEEVEQLMELFAKYLEKRTDELKERGVRIVHSGRKDRLSPTLAMALSTAIEKTKLCNKFCLQLALDYGGKDELLRAIKNIPVGTDVSEETLRAHLDHPELPDIDLIIRTSGEKRTSNFFLWQSTYAEWMFVDTYFPDFSGKDLLTAVDEFRGRKRRFGG